MKTFRWLIVLLTLLYATPLFAQTSLSTTVCPGAGCVTSQTSGQGGAGIQVTGTFVGTLTFSGSLDGATFAALPVTPIAGGAQVTTATAAGIWTTTVSGLAYVRVAFTSFSSGTAVVSAVFSAAKNVPPVTSTSLTAALPVNQGGTGLQTLTAHALYAGNGTTAPNELAVCGTGTYVRGVTGADPICSTLTLPNSAVQGDLIVATGSNTVGPITAVAAGSYLRSNGATVVPVYSTLTLPNAATQGDIIVATGANAVGSVPAVTAGSYLRSNGTSVVPIYSTLTLPNAATQGDLIVATGANAVGSVAAVTAGSYLRSNGTSAVPVYSTLTLPNAATQGDLMAASGANTEGAVAAVAAGSYLRSAGTSTLPAYSTTTLPNTTAAGNYLIATATNSVVAVTPALTHANPANQTGNATATFKMNGLGAAGAPCTITPVATGRVVFVLTGQLVQSLTADGVTFKLAYGTGTAPGNSAAATGTVISATQTWTGLTGQLTTQFAVQSMATGLALSTAAWYDLQIADVTGGTASATNIDCTAYEL